MSIFEDTNPRKLTDLLHQIETQATALPDFQRSFVWDPNATQQLIVSIASGYPAGSLLRIRNTHNLFANREIEGAPSIAGSKPTYLILDGQQRLTSLYQAFYGKGNHRFYVNLEKFFAGKELEECFFYIKAMSPRAKRLEQTDVQAKEFVLPLSVLSGGTGGFSQWSHTVRRTKPPDQRDQIEDDLREKVEQAWVKTIENYLFPVVTLSDATSAEAICNIFETLNSTGIKLGVFELLTARFLPKGVKLRDRLVQATISHPIIKDFKINPYYLLQAISLASRSSPSCKRGEVLELTADEIENWWQPVVEGMGRTLELLKQCGVLTPKWMPYDTALPTMAAVLAKNPIQNTPADAVIRTKMTRWFWCAVFGQVYQNSPNTQAAKDTTELLAWINEGGVPETVSAFSFDPASLRETTPRQRAVYRGVIALLLSRQPLDFFQGSPIDEAAVQSKNVDDHHIFPQGHLR